MRIPNVGKIRYLILFVSVGMFLILVYVVWRIAFFGTATVQIEGFHDPLTTKVVVDENSTLLPSGNEGRTYRVEQRIGNASVEISGPQIKSQNTKIEVEAFSETSKTIVVESITADELATTLSDSAVLADVSKATLFGKNKDWLVVELSQPGVGDGRYFYVYLYNYPTAEWRLLVDGVKIDLENVTNRSLPVDLTDYLEIMASD
jgi:hypothetical protein